ncbi:MAG: replication initiation factor domain-containing protein [Rhodocyclaceae bacterium]|nr:replication initiation factor domain-containing protein [Rhodocyclaceae bacterium]
MRDSCIDWVGFTVSDDVFEEMPVDAVSLVRVFMPTATIGDSVMAPRNFYRYTRGVYAFVSHEAVLVALICWGGDRQRATVNVQINGKGCALIEDWARVRDWIDSRDGKLTRVDTAVDFMDGEHNVDSFFELFKSGGFNWNNAPKHRLAGPWGVDTNEGRSLYIGKKENGKECCVYEKGRQLMPGDSPWNRLEVRWFAKDRILPLDMLCSPSEYLAGAYPCMSDVMTGDGKRIATEQPEYDMTAHRYTEYLKRCAGKIIHTLRATYTTDADMLDQLAVVGIPKRLRKASLVLVRNPVVHSDAPYKKAGEVVAEDFVFGDRRRAAM